MSVLDVGGGCRMSDPVYIFFRVYPREFVATERDNKIESILSYSDPKTYPHTRKLRCVAESTDWNEFAIEMKIAHFLK